MTIFLPAVYIASYEYTMSFVLCKRHRLYTDPAVYIASYEYTMSLIAWMHLSGGCLCGNWMYIHCERQVPQTNITFCRIRSLLCFPLFFRWFSGTRQV